MNNEQRQLAVAKKRQVFGVVELKNCEEVTLGDVLSFNLVSLLMRETKLTGHQVRELLKISITNGARYVIRSETPTDFQLGKIRVWMQTGELDQFNGGYLYETSEIHVVSVSHLVKEPKWWEVEDDVTVGTDPVYEGEEAVLA
jgi:hypothetical protein